MSEVKHTPGPWIADTGEVPKLGHAIGVLKQSHKPGKKGESICIISLAKDAEPHDHANARLIAAAPDLFQALDDIVTNWSEVLPSHRLEQARDAIAKAKGEAQ